MTPVPQTGVLPLNYSHHIIYKQFFPTLRSGFRQLCPSEHFSNRFQDKFYLKIRYLSRQKQSTTKLNYLINWTGLLININRSSFVEMPCFTNKSMNSARASLGVLLKICPTSEVIMQFSASNALICIAILVIEILSIENIPQHCSI